MSQTDLYRFFNANGALLYIGISLSAVHRASQHKGDKAWWSDVSKMTVERISGTRADALAAERRAIVQEKPLHNVVHNGTRRTLADWKCEQCGCAADLFMAIRAPGTTWHCTCVDCDPYIPEPPNLYWFSVKTIRKPEQVYDWEKHLLAKSWMDEPAWATWDAMVDACRVTHVPARFRTTQAERARKMQRRAIRSEVSRTFGSVIQSGTLRAFTLQDLKAIEAEVDRIISAQERTVTA